MLEYEQKSWIRFLFLVEWKMLAQKQHYDSQKHPPVLKELIQYVLPTYIAMYGNKMLLIARIS